MMIFVKVRNIIAVLAGVLGLVLSFTSALYWQYHFDFNELTAMHVAGIFVMLGIGADDIFLTIDSFEHSKLDFLKDSKGERLSEEHLSEPPIIKNRMILAYKTAGSVRGLCGIDFLLHFLLIAYDPTDDACIIIDNSNLFLLQCFLRCD